MTTEELIALSSYHESIEPYAYAHQGTLFVRLRLATDAADRVEVIHFDKFMPDSSRTVILAEPYAKDGAMHTVYQAQLRQETKRFKYYFLIHRKDEQFFYSRVGVTKQEPEMSDSFEVPYLGERDAYNPPAWTVGTTYYQIFPDRFQRTRKDTASLGLSQWDDVPTPQSFFGGDLAGIMEKLDHLSLLGVEVLYMTPIFRAPSNHKYDTVDYFAIDPSFGTEDDLRALVHEAHRRGIRVVLDAVFNHMGAENPIFLDLLDQGQSSLYADWIYAKSWPLSKKQRNYETFADVPSMPKWRTANPAVEDYLCQVGEYWIQKAGIDGWRLDVSDEVEHAFWKQFRKRVKSLDADALICGEIWQVATPWLRGDEFDSVMNYPFGRAVLDWLAHQTIDAREFYLRMEHIRTLYPEPVLPVLWNLLDSHDTPRLLTECDGNVTQAKLASFLQFASIGSPLLYYGDEVGMCGGADPLCRGGMVWDSTRQDVEMLEHYKSLIAVRRSQPALRVGNYRPAFFDVSPHVYGFVRTYYNEVGMPAETVLCLINNHDVPVSLALCDPVLPVGTYRNIFGDLPLKQMKTGDTLLLSSKSGSLWVWVGDQ